jgi:hypothetical protein
MGLIINVETAVESSAEVFDDLSLLLYGGHDGPGRGIDAGVRPSLAKDTSKTFKKLQKPLPGKIWLIGALFKLS